ncbi:Mu transposase C-terminal domain-containing protein [Aliarcobacter butzleri]
MSKINLSINSNVFHNNKAVRIKKHVDLKNIMVEDQNNNSYIVAISELSSTHQDIINQEYLNSFTNEQWEEAKKRLSIIKPLLNNRYRTKESVENIARTNNLHYSTLYRWISLYENTELLSSLVPKFSNRGGKDHVRIKEETELIINKVINELYLHKQKLTPKQVYIEIIRRCKNARIKMPHENTVRNRIKKLSEKMTYKHRESKRNAERLYKNTDGIFPAGKYPLDVIQIDHTPMDIIVVDEKYRQPLPRPFLTLAIDVYSRMIVGFYISLEEPSYFSVSQCLTQAILAKEKVLRDYGVEGEWNIWGIPRALHVDNGQDFRSIELQRTCEQYNISIEWRPVARPQFGGHIERLIGTAMQKIHSLPGTTFSNIKQRGEYKSEKEAVMTLQELEQWFCEYVVNIYHKSIHSSIGMTPEKKLEIGIFGDEYELGKGLPEKIEDEDYFKTSLLPSVERTIQQSGISIDNIHYYHDVLRKWIKSKDDKGSAKKFIFKIDPRDISTIWFYDPNIKDYFPIPYRNISYPPISRWEFRSIKQFLATKNINNIDETTIFKAYETMKKIQEESTTKTVRKQQEAKKTHKRKITSSNSTQVKEKKQNAIDISMDDLFKDIKPFNEIEV